MSRHENNQFFSLWVFLDDDRWRYFLNGSFLSVTTIGLCLRSYLVYHCTLFCISHFADILMKHSKMFSWMQVKKRSGWWMHHEPLISHRKTAEKKSADSTLSLSAKFLSYYNFQSDVLWASLPNKLQPRWEIKVLWTQKTNPSRPSETRSKIFAFTSDQIENFRSRFNLLLFSYKVYRFSAVTSYQLFLYSGQAVN